MKINVDELIVTIFSVYALQVGLDESLKNAFYDKLQFTVTKLGSSEYLYLCGDFNATSTRKPLAMQVSMVASVLGNATHRVKGFLSLQLLIILSSVTPCLRREQTTLLLIGPVVLPVRWTTSL